MKIQGRMFIWLSFFLLIMAVVYGVWSKEPAGTTALFLAFGLAIMIGFYLGFTARRVDAGAQDDKEADVADGAGELGFFSRTAGSRSCWASAVPSPSSASRSAGG